MRIRELETVWHVHNTINIHIKVATAPVVFSLFTAKYAHLLCQHVIMHGNNIKFNETIQGRRQGGSRGFERTPLLTG